MQAIGEVLYDLISVIDNFWVGSRGLERFFQIKKSQTFSQTKGGSSEQSSAAAKLNKHCSTVVKNFRDRNVNWSNLYGMKELAK